MSQVDAFLMWLVFAAGWVVGDIVMRQGLSTIVERLGRIVENVERRNAEMEQILDVIGQYLEEVERVERETQQHVDKVFEDIRAETARLRREINKAIASVEPFVHKLVQKKVKTAWKSVEEVLNEAQKAIDTLHGQLGALIQQQGDIRRYFLDTRRLVRNLEKRIDELKAATETTRIVMLGDEIIMKTWGERDDFVLVTGFSKGCKASRDDAEYLPNPAKLCLSCPEANIYVEALVATSRIKRPLSENELEVVREIASKYSLDISGRHDYEWRLTCVGAPDCIERIRLAAREIRKRLGIDITN